MKQESQKPSSPTSEQPEKKAMKEAAFALAGIGSLVACARVSNHWTERPSKNSLLSQCIVGGAANALTSAFLNPTDVIKTRMQTEIRERGTRSATYSSTLRSVRLIYAQSGLAGLWVPGLTATMVREMINCSARTGLYAPVRNFLGGLNADGELTAVSRVGSALITGALGSVLSNPSDVVKVRLLNVGDAYPSTHEAFPALLRAEGVTGLFRGVVPSTLRGASISVGALAAYDQAKQELKRGMGIPEGFVLHILASLVSGLAATTMAAPFDLVKTRVMNGHSAAPSLHHLRAAVRTEGPAALFRGWVPSYIRIGPHALIGLPVLEQLRNFVGVGYL